MALVEELEHEWKLAGARLTDTKARIETARKALNIYEEALEEENAKKKSPNVHKLSNVG